MGKGQSVRGRSHIPIAMGGSFHAVEPISGILASLRYLEWWNLNVELLVRLVS